MRVGRIMAVLFLLFCCSVHAAAAKGSLQSMIDRAEAGSTIVLPDGTYAGPLLVAKPLTIKGTSNTLIVGGGAGPVITIEGSGVTLDGFAVEQQDGADGSIAIAVKGTHHLLRSLSIRTAGGGVGLVDAAENKLESLQISGQKQAGKSLHKGNGIDLFASHRNRIVQCAIQDMQDGVYVEKSDGNELIRNEVSGCRYGLHAMYAKASVLAGNTLHHNTTGAMVMEAQATRIEDNTFVDQQKHVFSQGLLLYAANGGTVAGNRFERNRVGVYLERSKGNDLHANRFAANFIGMQVRQSADNAVAQNDFIGNVVHAQATESEGNRLQHNYWDDHQGVEAADRQTSSLPYEIDPFFLTVIKAHPGYQLMFQSPGMNLLKQLLKADSSMLLVDAAPALGPQSVGRGSGKEAGWPLGLSAGMLLAGSMTIFVRGRKS
ncbi:right-handed parallel beta-helix repeat-containing protein [Brevibacillus fluminis]|uniref:right-handed parallel beta-helix repeat-containing protein n=1 Tax=Brevibacillus fluminis TaxID=511487 RepID=UPI003F893C31